MLMPRVAPAMLSVGKCTPATVRLAAMRAAWRINAFCACTAVFGSNVSWYMSRVSSVATAKLSVA